MIGLYVRVPIACWRKGYAREYLETEDLPPPSTAYGFLLSLVGEEDRRRHVGVRLTTGIFGFPARSAVLRTLWRVKTNKNPPGVGENARPDYQQLILNAEVTIWCDSGTEAGADTLEARVRRVMADPASVERFGGLSLGESTHLVDEYRLLQEKDLARKPKIFLLNARGRKNLTIWVDHVGSTATRYATGDLVPCAAPPDLAQMPQILVQG